MEMEVASEVGCTRSDGNRAITCDLQLADLGKQTARLRSESTDFPVTTSLRRAFNSHYRCRLASQVL